MKKRILAGVAAISVIVALVVPSIASAIFSGTYAGRITGINGNGDLGFKGGTVKMKVSQRAKVTSFKFAKIRVLCAGNNVFRTSGHIAPNARIVKHNGVPQFSFTGHNSNGATLKVFGFFRGQSKVRGVLNFHGVIPTTGGTSNCKTFSQRFTLFHVS